MGSLPTGGTCQANPAVRAKQSPIAESLHALRHTSTNRGFPNCLPGRAQAQGVYNAGPEGMLPKVATAARGIQHLARDVGRSGGIVVSTPFQGRDGNTPHLLRLRHSLRGRGSRIRERGQDARKPYGSKQPASAAQPAALASASLPAVVRMCMHGKKWQ